ncbi:hypothetical protein JHN63_49360, partial [Streptomyces sp. MBT65]|nr:hypothetical protein [Streptomyces sp. MBT65]
VASRHTAASGAQVVSLVVAEGAVEVRAHLVVGAASGTSVRVTGWSAGEGLRAELLPLHGLLDGEGVVGDGPSLFVALARVGAEPDPRPLAELVSVEVDGDHGVSVRWADGRRTGFRFRESAGRSGASSWSVTPR